MLLDNVEQQLMSYAVNTQNVKKSARNQINSLNTSKNELLKIFRDFEYALWQKTKTCKCRKSTESLPNKKTLIDNGYHYQKTARATNLVSKYNFVFNNKKSYF